jgi:hypothetical protein
LAAQLASRLADEIAQQAAGAAIPEIVTRHQQAQQEIAEKLQREAAAPPAKTAIPTQEGTA